MLDNTREPGFCEEPDGNLLCSIVLRLCCYCGEALEVRPLNVGRALRPAA